MDGRFLRAFPDLADLEPAAQTYLAAQLRPVRMAIGEALFHAGSVCSVYPFVLEGRVLVRRIARSGREIVLYRVLPGQTCIMTTSCLVSGDATSAEAVAETAVTGMALPPGGFAHLLETSAVFRRFAFAACARRIGELMRRIEQIADVAIDRRLAARLLEAADAAGVVAATHAVLAADIGSAREVVSRALARFASQGWVRMGRGRVAITAQAALRAACEEVTDDSGATVSDGAAARRLKP